MPSAVASTILVNQTLRDYRPFLPEISSPTLVAFGKDPKLTPPEAGEYISSQIPGARFELFEQSSHVPFLEEADRFNRVVGEFAASLS